MNHPRKTSFFRVVLLCLLITVSCAPPLREDNLRRQGRTPLPPPSVLELIQGNSLRITTFGEDVTLYFDPSGRIAAEDYVNNHDTGRWDVSESGELCLKLGAWWFGDLRCFTVWPDGGRYYLMRGDGGMGYQADKPPANPSKLVALAAEVARVGRQRTSYRGSGDDTEQKVIEGPSQSVPTPKAVTRSSYRSAHEIDEAPQPSGSAATTSDEQAGAFAASSAVPPLSGNELKNTVRWLARDCPGCNMENADLRAADLVAADLQGTNLRGANLRNANLRRARLQGANLESAVLEHANLPGADMRNANLRNANLNGANLIRADLTGANLQGADMRGALLEGTTGIR